MTGPRDLGFARAWTAGGLIAGPVLSVGPLPQRFAPAPSQIPV
jgi:hypothetical protein